MTFASGVDQLILDQVSSFNGTIGGFFTAGDAVIANTFAEAATLLSYTQTGADSCSWTLTDGANTAVLNFAGEPYAQSDFSITSANGGAGLGDQVRVTAFRVIPFVGTTERLQRMGVYGRVPFLASVSSAPTWSKWPCVSTIACGLAARREHGLASASHEVRAHPQAGVDQDKTLGGSDQTDVHDRDAVGDIGATR